MGIWFLGLLLVLMDVAAEFAFRTRFRHWFDWAWVMRENPDEGLKLVLARIGAMVGVGLIVWNIVSVWS